MNEARPAPAHELRQVEEVLRLALEWIQSDGWVADAVLVVEHESDFLEVGHTAVDCVAGRLRVEAVAVGEGVGGGPVGALVATIGEEGLCKVSLSVLRGRRVRDLQRRRRRRMCSGRVRHFVQEQERNRVSEVAGCRCCMKCRRRRVLALVVWQVAHCWQCSSRIELWC